MPWQKLASGGHPYGRAASFVGGISNLGSTGGTSGVVGGHLVLAASSNYSLSQSSSSSGVTITLIGDDPIASYWREDTAQFYSSTTGSITNGIAHFVRMEIPHQMSFTRIDIPMSLSVATTASAVTAAMQLSAVAVLYSRSVSNILSPILGVSSTTTYSWASNTGVYLSVTGARVFSFPIATLIPRGEYYLGLQWSTDSGSSLTEAAATTALAASFIWVFGREGIAFYDLIGVQTNQGGASTLDIMNPIAGTHTNNVTFGPWIVNTADVQQQGLIGASPQIPIVILRGV